MQNFVVLFAALHYLTIAELGLFTVFYTSVLLIEVLLRYMLLMPLSITYSASDSGSQRQAGSRATGACIQAGIVIVMMCGGAALGLGPEASSSVLISGFAAAALIVQEAWRMYFFVIARPWRAVINEACCLVATILLAAILIIGPDSTSVEELIAVLGAGTGIGAVIGVAQTRIVPAVLGGGWKWLRDHWRTGVQLAASRGVNLIAGRISLMLIATIAGTMALGQYSASRTLMTPAMTLLSSIILYAVPEASRLHHDDGDRALVRFLVALSILLAAATTAVGVVIWMLPDVLGRLIAGDNWEVATQLMLPVILFTTANALQQGGMIGLLVRARPDWTLRVSTINGLLVDRGCRGWREHRRRDGRSMGTHSRPGNIHPDLVVGTQPSAIDRHCSFAGSRRRRRPMELTVRDGWPSSPL